MKNKDKKVKNDDTSKSLDNDGVVSHTTEAEDDVVFDDIEDNDAFSDKIKKIQKKLKVCMTERQEYLDGWQRAKADSINTKKSEEGRRKELIQFSQEGLLLDVLPVLDSFEMAFSNKKVWESVDKNWRKGIEHIHTQLVNVLKQYDLKSFDPLGEYFSPSQHDSVESVSADTKSDDGKIIEVLQCGYVLNDKVIRPAKVKVAVFKNKE